MLVAPYVHVIFKKYLFRNLLFTVDKHPNMKLVVVKEVEQLLYRSNIPAKAQYVSDL